MARSSAASPPPISAPVIVSSDSDVHGYEEHSIAAVIKRPHEAQAVDRAIRDALAGW